MEREEKEGKEKEEKEKEDEGVKKLNVTSPTPVHITAPDTTSPSLCDITKIPQATSDSTDTEEDVVTMTTAVRDDDGITEGLHMLELYLNHLLTPQLLLQLQKQFDYYSFGNQFDYSSFRNQFDYPC